MKFKTMMFVLVAMFMVGCATMKTAAYKEYTVGDKFVSLGMAPQEVRAILGSPYDIRKPNSTDLILLDDAKKTPQIILMLDGRSTGDGQLWWEYKLSENKRLNVIFTDGVVSGMTEYFYAN